MFGRELLMAGVVIGRHANDRDPSGRQGLDVVPKVAGLLRATRRGVLGIEVQRHLGALVVGELDLLTVERGGRKGGAFVPASSGSGFAAMIMLRLDQGHPRWRECARLGDRMRTAADRQRTSDRFGYQLASSLRSVLAAPCSTPSQPAKET